MVGAATIWLPRGRGNAGEHGGCLVLVLLILPHTYPPESSRRCRFHLKKQQEWLEDTPEIERSEGWCTFCGTFPCFLLFFLPVLMAASGKTGPKMAGATAEAGGAAQHSLTELFQDLKQDLLLSMKQLEVEMASKFLESLQPIQIQLKDLQLSLKHTENKADHALHLGELLRGEHKQLQQEVSDLKEKSVIMETVLKASYLKFRGVPELTDKSEDLIPFLRGWLARIMQLEEGLYPIISKAYRQGSPLSAKKLTPRDIVVSFGDEHVRNEILLLARKKGSLQYKDTSIKVFPVLPNEALQIRRRLKVTTQKLREEDIRYRWLQSGKLSVYLNGQQHLAYDEATGEELLKKLNLGDAMDISKKSNKRKYQQPLTPRKESKIPVKALH